MSFKKITTGCAFFATLMALAIVAEAQEAGRPDIEIKDIRQQQLDAPDYGASGSLGGHPATLWRTWLKIEIQFETQPKWSDDIQVKYAVLMGEHGSEKLFVGDITHINVAKGNQHYSAMFMHPNTLRRYGAGQIAAVEVKIFHQGKLLARLSQPPGLRPGWQENFSPTPGFLLPPQDTPWGPVADQRWEEVKPVSRSNQ